MSLSPRASIIDYPYDSLPKDLWDEVDGKFHMKPEIVEMITDEVDKILDAKFEGKNAWWRTIYFGSSAGTQFFSAETDWDFKIIIDYDIFRDHNPEYKGMDDAVMQKELVGKVRDEELVYDKHPIDLYVYDKKQILGKEEFLNRYDSLYDVIGDNWIKEPELINPENFDRAQVLDRGKKEALAWAEKWDLSLGSLKRDIVAYDMIIEHLSLLDPDEKNKFKEEIDKILIDIENEIKNLSEGKTEIKEIRQGVYEQPFSKDIENFYYSINFMPENIQFKLLQRYGYLGIIAGLEDALKDDDKLTEDEISTVKQVVKEGVSILAYREGNKGLEFALGAFRTKVGNGEDAIDAATRKLKDSGFDVDEQDIRPIGRLSRSEQLFAAIVSRGSYEWVPGRDFKNLWAPNTVMPVMYHKLKAMRTATGWWSPRMTRLASSPMVPTETEEELRKKFSKNAPSYLTRISNLLKNYENRLERYIKYLKKNNKRTENLKVSSLTRGMKEIPKFIGRFVEVEDYFFLTDLIKAIRDIYSIADDLIPQRQVQYKQEKEQERLKDPASSINAEWLEEFTNKPIEEMKDVINDLMAIRTALWHLGQDPNNNDKILREIENSEVQKILEEGEGLEEVTIVQAYNMVQATIKAGAEIMKQKLPEGYRDVDQYLRIAELSIRKN